MELHIRCYLAVWFADSLFAPMPIFVFLAILHEAEREAYMSSHAGKDQDKDLLVDIQQAKPYLFTPGGTIENSPRKGPIASSQGNIILL